MAWNDPTVLKFDQSKFSSMKSKLDTTASDLRKLSSDLLSEIDALRQTWKTPAGEKFFEKFDTGWVDEVDKYIEIIDAIKEILEVAETAYADVEEAAKNITF